MSTSAAAVERVRLAPVSAADRVELIDVLRGFALLGILVVNFWGSTGEGATRLDQIVNEGLEIFVSSSFYPLFSFLFGLGFALQLLRARERGAAVVQLYVRRLLALFLIGSFHAVVIWNGDILVDYAMIGFVLIPLHRLRDRWLWPIVALPLLLGLWSPQVRASLQRLGGEAAAEARLLRDNEDARLTRTATNLADRFEADPAASRMDAFSAALGAHWRQNAAGVRRVLSTNLLFNDILAFFVLGLIVGRRRILQEAERHRRSLAIVAAGGAMAAAAGAAILYPVEPQAGVLGDLGWYLSDYGMTALYISGIALIMTGWRGAAAWLRPLSAAGRIGLTNYLMQSTVMTLLFTRYGLNMDAPSTALWLMINVAFFFGVQLPFSRWWIARYRFGPAEWVWRTMTYGERQPMRIAAGSAADVPPQPVPAGG